MGYEMIKKQGTMVVIRVKCRISFRKKAVASTVNIVIILN